MEVEEIKAMSLKDLAKYLDEQKRLGSARERTQNEIAEIRGISVRQMQKQTDTFREKGERKMTTDVQESKQENTKVQESTNKNIDLTSKEIKVLKQIVKERESNIELFNEYQIYKELEKVPVDAETVRSAFNMSKETTERLRKYASVRRIPLQDLVELAVLNLLNKYDR
jgi:hypothetical protein